MAAYVVVLPRRDAWRFGMFSAIALRSEAIAGVVSLERDREVRLVQTDMRMAGALAQMFPSWRIERLVEPAIRPQSSGPVLLHPAILTLEEDTVVASGSSGHVDRGANRPILRWMVGEDGGTDAQGPAATVRGHEKSEGLHHVAGAEPCCLEPSVVDAALSPR